MELQYEHKGTSYLDLLKRFHDFLQPETYLEIGTLNGETLKLAKCSTICVDPMFQISSNPTLDRQVTMLFQMTSDRFFQKWSPSTILRAPVDLAFLDGLHEAETLMRDFANLEKHCRPNSIICLHDCVPMNEEMTNRKNNGGLWTGDVWKIVPILKKKRPELQIVTFDAGPTGLVCCTNLDPKSQILDEDYGKIWNEWRNITLSDYGFNRLIELVSPTWTEDVKDAESLRQYFWL